MKIGVISDVHGNLVALETVLAYLKQKSVDAIWFLGDAIGYGPWPKECVELLRQECSMFLAGNHEWLVCGRHDRQIYTSSVTATLDWTLAQVEGQMAFLKGLRPDVDLFWKDGFNDSSTPNPVKRYTKMEQAIMLLFYYRLTGQVDLGIFSYQPKPIVESPLVHLVHASLSEPVNEYIVPGQTGDAVFSNLQLMQSGVIFFGHTHKPTHVWRTENGEIHNEALSLGDPVVFNPKDGVRRMINPGSVGQPRDGDPRASFGILRIDGDPASVSSRWTFVNGRKAYDIDKVVAEYVTRNLPDANGRRLYQAQ